ncbi:MAG: hypothetical protein KatS3mg090_0753 [Patescibacteria group bacterium]|nr:MAG: hypothetical protein KatS3mg090_0753 [Patescibacteria group bacterium]
MIYLATIWDFQSVQKAIRFKDLKLPEKRHNLVGFQSQKKIDIYDK